MAPLPGAGPRLPRVGPYKRPGDRRTTYRRSEDRAAHAALAFSLRASAILGSEGPPSDAVARILALLARTSGARRAVALVPRPQRTVYAAVGPAEPPRHALDLAAWLDSAAHRARHERATGPAAAIEVVELTEGGVGVPGAVPERPVRLAIPLGDRDEPVLGLDFASRRPSRLAAERLPPPLLLQAAGALSVACRLASDRGVSESAAATDNERRLFLSTVVHELRTPLTGLSGYLDLLLEDRGADPAIRAEFLERSRRIVESMAELVNDLLEMSRIEAGSLDLVESTFPVADIIGAARDAVEPLAAAKQVTLDVGMPSRLRAALGDRRAAERIMVNLAGNAVKYVPAGGRVEVSSVFDGPVALVIVRDTGPGVPAADRARIFERFARLDVHRPLPGTGLGLPIARELARLMGGDVAVASRPGVGSSFCLAMPGPTRPDLATVMGALDRLMAAEAVRLGDEDASSPPQPVPESALIHHPQPSPETRG